MEDSKKQIIGDPNNFWLYSKEEGYDLIHAATPSSPSLSPRLILNCTKVPVTIDPKKTALVIIDMQNYFLSPLIGRPKDAMGLKAMTKL